MYCKRCNKNFSDEYMVCPECGDLLEQEIKSNGFEVDDEYIEDDYTRKTKHYNSQHEGIKDKSGTYIVLSILEILCVSPIPGIIALIFSLIGANDFKNGEYEEASRKWGYAKIALWVGVILVILSFIFFVLVFTGGIFDVIASVSRM